jgi:hypothetical protein
VDVVNDGADLRQIEHRVGDEELEHRDPEVVVVEAGPESCAEDGSHQPLRAAESVDLSPAQRRLDREISRGLHEVVGHPLRVRQRQVRRADVLPPADVQEPPLLLNGPSSAAQEPDRIHEGGHRPLGEQVSRQRGELAAGVVGLGPPPGDRAHPAS